MTEAVDGEEATSHVWRGQFAIYGAPLGPGTQDLARVRAVSAHHGPQDFAAFRVLAAHARRSTETVR